MLKRCWLINIIYNLLLIRITLAALNCDGDSVFSRLTTYNSSHQDSRGHAVISLQDYLDGHGNYVTVAVDEAVLNRRNTYGATLCIQSLNKKYQKSIPFQIRDTIPSLKTFGLSRIAINVNGDELKDEKDLHALVTIRLPFGLLNDQTEVKSEEAVQDYKPNSEIRIRKPLPQQHNSIETQTSQPTVVDTTPRQQQFVVETQPRHQQQNSIETQPIQHIIVESVPRKQQFVIRAQQLNDEPVTQNISPIFIDNILNKTSPRSYNANSNVVVIDSPPTQDAVPQYFYYPIQTTTSGPPPYYWQGPYYKCPTTEEPKKPTYPYYPIYPNYPQYPTHPVYPNYPNYNYPAVTTEAPKPQYYPHYYYPTDGSKMDYPYYQYPHYNYPTEAPKMDNPYYQYPYYNNYRKVEPPKPNYPPPYYQYYFNQFYPSATTEAPSNAYYSRYHYGFRSKLSHRQAANITKPNYEPTAVV